MLGLYTLMIGAGVSSLRALVMFLMRIGADMTGRDYDLPTSLSLAAAAVCAWQPLYLADAGFLLSFGAILGICLFSPVFSEMFTGEKQKQKNSRNGDVSLREKLRRAVLGLAESLSSSMAVSLMLLGPTLYFYFEIPPYSVFLNILVIPVMPLAMGAGLPGLAALSGVRAGRRRCPSGLPRGPVVLRQGLYCGRKPSGEPDCYRTAGLILAVHLLQYAFPARCRIFSPPGSAQEGGGTVQEKKADPGDRGGPASCSEGS